MHSDYGNYRRRVAALSLPSLLNRCQSVLWGFLADEAIRGHCPFPRFVYYNYWLFLAGLCTMSYRSREEELIYVLRKLLSLKLWPGSLWAALSESPSKYSESQPGECRHNLVAIFPK